MTHTHLNDDSGFLSKFENFLEKNEDNFEDAEEVLKRAEDLFRTIFRKQGNNNNNGPSGSFPPAQQQSFLQNINIGKIAITAGTVWVIIMLLRQTKNSK